VIRAHLVVLDDGHMDPAPALYTIRINGHLGAMMLSAFPSMRPRLRGAETVLTGLLDRSALYGMLADIDALGLDLLEVRQLTPDPEGGQTVTSQHPGAPGASPLPDYAPVPRASLGPAVNGQDYYVGRVERNLYWVTDGDYHSAFLTTSGGVVLFDAPPTIGQNLQRAVNDIAVAEGVSNTVTHLVYTHHHSDHAGGSSLFGSDVVRIGHEETRRLLLRDNDPAKPPPEVTFADHRTLDIGGEHIELAWHGSNHSPDNIYIHFPDHDTLMLVDIVLPGWVPFYGINLSEDVPGYIEAAAKALSYPWKHLIAGHLGRLGSRDDVTLHQQYIADIEAGARTALATVDPTPYYQKYGDNPWAAVKAHLDAVADAAAAPVIEKYTGVLGAVDVFTNATAFTILESIRLDLGYRMDVHS